MSKDEEDKDMGLMWLGILIGGALVGLLVLISFLGDESDTINTREYGKQICKSYNLEYNHREIVVVDNEVIPKIYCKKPTQPEKQLVDGLIVIK